MKKLLIIVLSLCLIGLSACNNKYDELDKRLSTIESLLGIQTSKETTSNNKETTSTEVTNIDKLTNIDNNIEVSLDNMTSDEIFNCIKYYLELIPTNGQLESDFYNNFSPTFNKTNYSIYDNVMTYRYSYFHNSDVLQYISIEGPFKLEMNSTIGIYLNELPKYNNNYYSPYYCPINTFSNTVLFNISEYNKAEEIFDKLYNYLDSYLASLKIDHITYELGENIREGTNWQTSFNVHEWYVDKDEIYRTYNMTLSMQKESNDTFTISVNKYNFINN